jgi:hypothetical protein
MLGKILFLKGIKQADCISITHISKDISVLVANIRDVLCDALKKNQFNGNINRNITIIYDNGINKDRRFYKGTS